jgi:prepilin-type N-terminal cleavage/methylation domain-containing protein
MKSSQGGFTIVEVIVVIAVFAIGLAALTTLFSSLQVAERSTYYLSVATHAARSEIERIRSSGFSTVNDGDSFTSRLPSTLPTGSLGTIKVTTPANAPNSKQIDATVSYPVGSVWKQVTISAYVDPPGGI